MTGEQPRRPEVLALATAHNGNINGASPASPSSALAPTWGPPKTPLAPDRLAKLANALGVSTPIPPSSKQAGTPFLSRSFSESSGPPENIRRSPTPSMASSFAGYGPLAPSTSRFLLHVIPPMHLPHDSESYDSDLTPPPPTASGYHTQFRRGTLVPVHSTLQAQLGAIAKEYALPSTVGLILYLVSSGSMSDPTSPMSTGVKSPTFDGAGDEPGPRLSDDIWRHLWVRILQQEQRDGNMLLLPPISRSPTPLMLNPSAGRSSPFLRNDANANLVPPSPLSPRPSYPSITSPSTPSSASDLRFNSKSAPPSSDSTAQSEPATPDTSVDVHDTPSVMRANSLDLPGLTSPSLIPILAKVEFDIDPRKAAWYKPWVRSRKVNHAKRAGSQASRKASGAESGANERESENAGDKPKVKVPAIPLLMSNKANGNLDALLRASPVEDAENEVESCEPYLNHEDGYEQLSDSDSDSDEDDFAEDSTAKVSSISHGKGDPLEDVFGTDEDTWEDMKAERRITHELDPNIVELALTGGQLSMDEDSYVTDQNHFTREEEEVREMLDRMSQGGRTPESTYEWDGSSTSLSKKHIPAPLVLVPKPSSDHLVASEPTPLTGDPTSLAYLEGDSPEHSSDIDDETYAYRAKSPTESEKRAGTLFEDFDLGLDPSEDYDDNDPNDRRRSQYVMSAQLDEIERTLAQLSPRILKTDLEDELNRRFSSATLSPNSPAKLTLSPLRSSDLSHSPRLPHHPDPPHEPTGGASWPAIPFSLIKSASEPEDKSNRAQSPPQLAVNGITTSAPRSFAPRDPSAEASSETVQRKKELEEHHAFYGQNRQNSSDSPVIPLSPDPFGRFSSSTPDIPPIVASSQGEWDTVTMGRTSITLGADKIAPPFGRARSSTTTSRFSADSLLDEHVPTAAAAKANRGTLMSVKSIKNLWRKSNKSDKEKEKEKQQQQQPPVPNGASASGRASPAAVPKRSSGRISPGVPLRPERPSQENLDLPDVPALPGASTFGRYSPQPTMNRPPSRSSQESSRRPSEEMSRPPTTQGRPSLDFMNSQQRRPPMDGMHPGQQRPQDGMHPQMNSQGLFVPPYQGRNTSPIIPTQMLPGRNGATLDRLHFDQESPYPNPVRNVRYSNRTPSPPHPPLQQGQGPLASIPEQGSTQEPKSILKWKSMGGNPAYPPPQEPMNSRTSIDRTSNRSGGGRKASVASFSSDMPPPSPLPQDGFSNGGNSVRVPSVAPSLGSQEHIHRQAYRSGDSSEQGFGPRPVSPSRSFASSDRRTSIDSSQFEIVSPRLNSGMPYPSDSYGYQDS